MDIHDIGLLEHPETVFRCVEADKFSFGRKYYYDSFFSSSTTHVPADVCRCWEDSGLTRCLSHQGVWESSVSHMHLAEQVRNQWIRLGKPCSRVFDQSGWQPLPT